MIKQTTKITFKDTGETIEGSGGIPLSEGEIMVVDDVPYVVSSKQVKCRKEGEDWLADVEYKLRKQ